MVKKGKDKGRKQQADVQYKAMIRKVLNGQMHKGLYYILPLYYTILWFYLHKR